MNLTRGRGRGATALLLALWLLASAIPLLAFLSRAGARSFAQSLASYVTEPEGRRVILFGFVQALGSLSVALAVGLPGAFLVARRRFPGRAFLRALAVVPFAMPPILVALGFVLYYGRGGFLNLALMTVFGLEKPPVDLLYSFAGLCLVHGFYNFPLVLDMVASALEGLPDSRKEAARSLGAGRFRAFVTATLPSIAPALAEAASLAFLFSFFSFVVVAIFGPLAAATPETEIYRKLRMEGDLDAAAALAAIQTLIALATVAVISLSASRSAAVRSESPEGRDPRRPTGAEKAIVAVYFAFILVFFLAPLLSIGLAAFTERSGFGLPSFPSWGPWRRLLAGGALLRSLAGTLATALPAAAAATLIGFWLGNRLRDRKGLVETFSVLPLSISGVVAASGWHLVFPDSGYLAFLAVQTVTALPFALRSSAAALDALSPEPAMAARLLGASRVRALFGVELPAVLPVTLSSAAFSFALAAGDATTPLVIPLPGLETLPLTVYRLTASYRYPEACAAGLVLAALCASVFWIKGRTLDDARA